jgi:hypothetical protein
MAGHPLGEKTQQCLQNYGLGCFATHNTVGCTSLGAELTFIFGSCRAFFGEPCAPGGGLTHGYGYGNGNGNGNGNRGCSCGW